MGKRTVPDALGNRYIRCVQQIIYQEEWTMKMRRLLTGLLTAALLTSLAGCGSGAAEPADVAQGTVTESRAPEETADAAGTEAKAKENKDITIAYVTSALTTQIFRDQVTALQNYCDEIGVNFVYTAQEDIGKQLEACDNYISMGVDCLMVHVTDVETYSDTMKRCQEAGIPWFSYDTNIEGSDAYYGWDNYELGYAIGTNAANWVNENFAAGEVVYAASNNYPSAAFLVTREQGYKDALEKLCEADIQWVAEAAGGTTDNGVTAGENFLQCGYDLNLVCAINDSGLCGVYQAFQAAGYGGDKVALFGCDSDPEALDAIAEGGIYKGTINTGLISLAPEFIDICVNLANGQQEGEHWGEFILITKDNVEEWR